MLVENINSASYICFFCSKVEKIWKSAVFCQDFCLLSSRHASAQAVTLKWQHRTTSPMNKNSSAGENRFSAKNGS